METRNYPTLQAFYDYLVNMPIAAPGLGQFGGVRISYNEHKGSLFVLLVDPITANTFLARISVADELEAKQCAAYLKERYYAEIPYRFGLFRPSKIDGFAAYDTWQAFKQSWLYRDDLREQTVAENIPLLFDFMPALTYEQLLHSGQEVLGYQRLLVTTYIPRKGVILDFIIKDQTDASIKNVYYEVTSLMQKAADYLFEIRQPNKVNADA